MDNELELRRHSGQCSNLLRLVTVPTASGGVLLACSDSDAMVQLWDPWTGEAVAGPVKVDSLTVVDMGVVGLTGGQRALATCGLQYVALWDPATFGTEDAPLGRFDVTGAMGMAVVPATETSPDLLVTAENDLVRVLDPRDGATVSGIRLPARPGVLPSNRVYHPTGVRFGDGAAGFAVDHFGRLEVWRLDGRELTGRKFRLSQPFRGAMTYLPGEGGRAWLAVAVARGIEVWDLDSGRRVARGELDSAFEVLAPVPLDGRTLVAAAFGRGFKSGVLLWDPATQLPVTGIFNQHGLAFGKPNLAGVAIRAVVAVPYPDGVVRIASCGNDGVVRVSPPVDELLARGAEPASGFSPAAGSADRSGEPAQRPRRSGGLLGRLLRRRPSPGTASGTAEGTLPGYVLVRDRSGAVVGIWLRYMEHVRNDVLIAVLLYREDLTHLLGRPRRIVPNTVDDNGGAFVMFDEP